MRIIIADDQHKVRFALRVFLERQPGIQIVGEASDADELLCQIGKSCPDGVLLAWELPGLSGSELVSALKRIRPGLILVALSSRCEVRWPALAAGADDFVCKADPPECLLTALGACLKAPTREPQGPGSGLAADCSPA